MKKIIHRIQELGQRADQIKAAVQSVPPKVMEIREAVTNTAGQLRQLRSEVQTSFTGLRVNDDERLTEAMKEINDQKGLLLRAGFHLSGIDLDLGITRRIIAHLEKVEDVSPSALRAMASANQGRETLHSILSAMIQAEELARKSALPGLVFEKLIVEVGLAPSVRVCWRSETMVADTPDEAVNRPDRASTPPPAPVPPPLAASPYGQGSFFERRTDAPQQVTPVAAVVEEGKPATPAIIPPLKPGVAPVVAAHSLDPDGRKSALDRFKKMPDLSRR